MKRHLKPIALAISVALAGSTLLVSTPSIAASDAVVAQQGQPSQEAASQDRAKHWQRRAERRQQRFARLKEELKLDAAQETAWDAYTKALTPAPGTWKGKPGPDSSSTVAQRMERVKAHLARQQQVVDATLAFYGSLSAEQQQVMDKWMKPSHGKRGHFHNHRKDHGHGEARKS